MARNWKNSTLAERLEHVLQKEDWSKADLRRATRAGSDGTVGNWFYRNASMDRKYADRLQVKHGWNSRWLLDAEGPERVPALDPEKAAILKELETWPVETLRAIKALRSV